MKKLKYLETIYMSKQTLLFKIRDLFESMMIFVERLLKHLPSNIKGYLITLGDLTALTFETLKWGFIPPFRVRILFQQMVHLGVDSLPIVIITSLFTGMVLALQTAHQIAKFGADIYVGGIVGISMTRELGPVLTALMVAGRVGAGITAEIGTMKVTEQISALETLATNPVQYLIVPRVIACILMLPVLTMFADFIGFLGGYIVGVFRLGINSALYIDRTVNIVETADIYNGLFKTFFFGYIISIVGCYMGFNTKGGAEGVGRATTISVVTSCMLIFISDYFLTAILFVG